MAAFFYALIFGTTLFLSAALLFFLQLMIGKVVMIRLGGTPAVWNTCLVLFQATLLAGYLYAHVLYKLPGKRWQPLFHLLVLAVPFLLFLPVDLARLDSFADGHLVLETFRLLLIVVGVPLFVVSSTAPLMQGWLAKTPHPSAHDPYFLYAASNMGSLLALASFPLWIEGSVPLDWQNRSWLIGFGLLAAMVFVCALLVWLAPWLLKRAPVKVFVGDDVAQVLAVEANGPPTVLRRLRWIFLAAVPASLLLGLSTTLTLDIMPGPLFWGVPLALYLFTFILAFARIPLWQNTNIVIAVVVQVAHGAAILGLAAMLFFVPDSATRDLARLLLIALVVLIPYRWIIVAQPLALIILILCLFAKQNILNTYPMMLHLLAFYWTARLCHGELARDRPAAAFLTEFYFWVAAGGVLGGLFNVLLAPILFVRSLGEYTAALALGCTARPAWVRNGVLDWLLSILMEAGNTALRTGKHLHRVFLAYSFDFLAPIVALFLTLTAVSLANEPMWGPNKVDLMQWLQSRAQQNRDWIAYDRIALYHAGLVLGVPLLFCLAVVARPIRFGLSLGAVCLAFGLNSPERGRETTVFVGRSSFGYLKVVNSFMDMPAANGGREEVHYHYLMHGSTHHGMNLLQSTAALNIPGQPTTDYRRLAATYYHRRGPAGIVMERYNWFPGPDNTYWADARLPASPVGLSAPDLGLNLPLGPLVGPWTEPPIAVVGLGTGTLASYGRPYQHIDFFEIDPMVTDLSFYGGHGRMGPYFHFLEDATRRGVKVKVVSGDGRLALKKVGPDAYYQAIFVDAFSSDAIPVHLLTREAMVIYFQKLAPGGVVCFHTSNRHVDLTKVVADVAGDLGYTCMRGKDDGEARIDNPAHFASEWVVVARSEKDVAHLQPPPGFGDKPNAGLGRPAEPYWQRLPPTSQHVWTDDKASLVAIARDPILPTILMGVLLILFVLTVLVGLVEIGVRAYFP